MNIGENTFCDCTSLKEITLPVNLMSMGKTSVGFAYDNINIQYNPIDGFMIKGWSGSLGELYANTYDFKETLIKSCATDAQSEFSLDRTEILQADSVQSH